MTRLVGLRDRTEFIPDPAQALRQGRKLDAMLAAARLPYPRGIVRASHRTMNEMDDQRLLEVARRLNAPA